MDGRRAARKHRSQNPAYRSARPPPYGEVLVPLDTGGVGDVVCVAPASGVGVREPVGVGRPELLGNDVGDVEADVDGVASAGAVGVLLCDGAAGWVRGRDGVLVRCVCWFAVLLPGATVGAGRTQRYSTNTPAKSNNRIHVERRVRLSSDRSGRRISSTLSPERSRRSLSR